MKKLLLIVLILALSACANLTPQSAAVYGLEAAQAAQAVLMAKAQVKSAEGILQSNIALFSTEVNAAIALVDQMTAGSTSGSTVLINLAQITQTYQTTKAAYISAKVIVLAHQSSYTPLQRAQLAQLDASMLAIDTAVLELNKAPSGTNITPLIISALQVAALTAKIALAAGV
jgi:Na+-transporting NADH:ubiquinone oxidoreductase subunit NqrC